MPVPPGFCVWWEQNRRADTQVHPYTNLGRWANLRKPFVSLVGADRCVRPLGRAVTCSPCQGLPLGGRWRGASRDGGREFGATAYQGSAYIAWEVSLPQSPAATAPSQREPLAKTARYAKNRRAATYRGTALRRVRDAAPYERGGCTAKTRRVLQSLCRARLPRRAVCTNQTGGTVGADRCVRPYDQPCRFARTPWLPLWGSCRAKRD